MTYVDTQNIQIQYKVFHQSNVTKGKRSISIRDLQHDSRIESHRIV